MRKVLQVANNGAVEIANVLGGYQYGPDLAMTVAAQRDLARLNA